jgi:hypothetical protein
MGMFILKERSEYQIKQISNIATDLIGNKVVFFIGAGFSRDLGYPGWGELLKEIISENNLMEKIKRSSLFYLISEKDHPEYEKINQLMLENLIGVDFLRLAGYVDILLKQNGKQDIQSEIKRKIIHYEEERINNIDKYNKYRDVFKTLSHYISEVITTNYDTNLEYCIENVSVIHRNLESINNKNFGNLKRNIKLYKIHGCITDENNGIIITEKDYQEFNSSNKYIFNKLYSTFIENNIVFIGYSLTDPNIRSLLNEVINEIKGNQLEKKKIYWINRGKINDIDRIFYENIYSMQIIDEIEILEFFNLLISLAKSKWIDMEKVETQWKEAANELISKVSLSQPEYIDLINKVCKSEKIEQVLMHIYNNFVVNDGVRKEADKAFFMLLSRSNNEIKAVFEPKVIDILSVEDNHLLTVIELIKDDPMVKTLFIEKRYSKKLLESLISRAKTINDFYLYKRYSIALLDYYEIFEGELGDLRNEFINAFYSNYKYLTDTRILGYSWESLSDVKAKIEVLDSCIIEEILNEYPNTTKSKIQVEQIKALTSKLEPAKRNELRFIHIIKPKFSSKIERSIYKLLNEFLVKDLKFESDWEKIDGKFVQMYNKDSSIITFDSVNGYDEESFIIKYEEKELKIRFYANYEMQELYLEIDGDKIVVNDLEEVNEILTKNIQEKLSQWLNTNQSV